MRAARHALDKHESRVAGFDVESPHAVPKASNHQLARLVSGHKRLRGEQSMQTHSKPAQSATSSLSDGAEHVLAQYDVLFNAGKEDGQGFLIEW